MRGASAATAITSPPLSEVPHKAMRSAIGNRLSIVPLAPWPMTTHGSKPPLAPSGLYR